MAGLQASARMMMKRSREANRKSLLARGARVKGVAVTAPQVGGTKQKRNARCGCGSGLKFKRCCSNKGETDGKI